MLDRWRAGQSARILDRQHGRFPRAVPGRSSWVRRRRRTIRAPDLPRFGVMAAGYRALQARQEDLLRLCSCRPPDAAQDRPNIANTFHRVGRPHNVAGLDRLHAHSPCLSLPVWGLRLLLLPASALALHLSPPPGSPPPSTPFIAASQHTHPKGGGQRTSFFQQIQLIAPPSLNGMHLHRPTCEAAPRSCLLRRPVPHWCVSKLPGV